MTTKAKTAASPFRRKLRPYQSEAGRAILQSVFERKGLTFSVIIARQGGKNELSAQLETLLLTSHMLQDLSAIKCAPTFKPQGEISSRRLWSRLMEAGLQPLCRREGEHVVKVGAAKEVFLSAEPSANVVGHTAQLLLEVDEAQDVDEEKFDREFRPMASTANATLVFYGTPWDESTLLERVKQHNLELERCDGLRRHFEFDWQHVARHNASYERFVESERLRLGETHPLYLTQYCLKTISGGGRLFSASQRAQMRGEHERISCGRLGETYVGGLDVGGDALDGGASGHDATVLTIARVIYPAEGALVREPRLEVVECRSWTGVAHDELQAQVIDLAKNVWRLRRLSVDATGVGESMARVLSSALGKDVVRAVRFTMESKSSLGYALLASVNGGRLKVYRGDGSVEYGQLQRELEAARSTYRANRTLNFYVDESDGHDDFLMSLALTVDSAADSRPRAARGRLRGGVW